MSDRKTLTAGGTLARLIRATMQQTEKAIKACPDGRWYHRLGPDKATPLWLLGHLANTADFIGNTVGLGASCGAIPKEWRRKFTPTFLGGDPITTNPADYPTKDEVIEAYRRSMNHLADAVAGLSDEELLGPPKGKMLEPLKALVSSLQDCVSLNIVHDSHHRGQLAMLANAPE